MSEFLTPHDPRANLPAHPVYAPGSAYVPDPELEETPLRKNMGALRRYYWVVLLMGLVGLGIAYYAVENTEPMFSSKAVLQMAEDRASGGGGGLAGLAASLGGGGSSIRSQVEVVRSRVLLGEVVDSLGLRLQRQVPGILWDSFEPTGIVDQVTVARDATADTLHLSFAEEGVRVQSGRREISATYGEPVEVGGVRFTVPARPDREELTLFVLARTDAVEVLHDAVRPASREGTNLVDVVVNGYDPVITQRIANTTAEFYKRFSSSRSREQAQRRKQFVVTQLMVAESLLTETQSQLTEFRKRERVYSSKAEATIESAGRGEIEMRRAELDAERRAYRTILAELPRANRERKMDLLRSIAASPGVSENPVIGGLYQQLARYDAQRDSLLAGPPRRSATNPDVRAVDSLAVTTEAKLAAAARSYVDVLEAQVAALDGIKARTDSALQHIAVTEPEEVRLMLRMESIGEAAKELRERYYTAGMSEAAEIDQITILDDALRGEPSGSGPMRSLVFGLVFGLLVGGTGAVLLDSANRTIRRREEMEHLLRIPRLGAIPPLAPGAAVRGILPTPRRMRNGSGMKVEPGKELVAATRVHSSVAEAFRALRTNLTFAPGMESLRSLVVTSATGAEGKTTTAANLAIAYAQQGRRVLLVDCDVRNPRVHTLFGVAREPGLSQLLLGKVAAEQVIVRSSVEGLSLLPAGPLPTVSATDLFGGGVVRSLVEALSGDFDMVILDTAPVLAAANAAVLGTQVDGVLMVVRAGWTDRDSARQAVQQLGAVGARVVGAVLNDPDGNVAWPRGYYDEEPASA